MWEVIGSAVAGAFAGQDVAMTTDEFFGGDTSWGGTWSVATSGSKANATSTPSAGVDSWLVPVAVVAGVAILAAALLGGRR